MVSILYRTHKGLSSSAKISSIYAIDALARAARHQVNKTKIVADVNAGSGNCATFLLKIEGILDGLYHDIVSSRNSELKVSSRNPLLTYRVAKTVIRACIPKRADMSRVTTLIARANASQVPSTKSLCCDLV